MIKVKKRKDILKPRKKEKEEKKKKEYTRELFETVHRRVYMPFLKYIYRCVPKYIFLTCAWGHPTIFTNPKYITRLVSFLYLDHNTQSKLFTDLFGVDYLNLRTRFLLVYHLYSVMYNMRIFIKLYANEVTWVPSIVHIFPAARWYEREVWDMYGVHFSNNGDLRRILTDYGFRGYPLRKDFPISGFVEVRYSERLKTLIYSDVRLLQEFRDFDARMPWEYFYTSIPEFFILHNMDKKLHTVEQDESEKTDTDKDNNSLS
jgi:NADH-quinone oxidoreductase subunit C